MNIKMESAIAIISAVFVIFTAMVDPKASFSVATVAIVCLLAFMVFGKGSKAESKSVNKPAMAKKNIKSTKKSATASKKKMKK